MTQKLPHSRQFITSLILGLAVLLGACASPPPTAAPSPTPGLPATAAPALPSPTATLPPTSTPPPPTPTPQPTATETPLPTRGQPSIGDPYAPELGNTGYDVQRYTLQLAFTPGQTVIEGTAILEAASTQHNLVQFSVDFAGLIIDELLIDSVPADYTREDGKLIITPPQPLAEGETFALQIAYNGTPATESSRYVPFVGHLGLQFLGDNIYAVSEPDGAHYWFPSNDHPQDKAAFRFEITVPEGFTGAANGVLLEEIDHGDTTTFVWEHNYPMATYLATIAVGEYERIDDTSPGGIPLRHYIFPDLELPFTQAASVTGEALDWMSDLFGPYPFETYGFVTTRLIRASLETQTMVILSENMLNEETVIHEIVHMWFGDWVSMESWADMWHNEGFAVYMWLMWQTRENPASLNVHMQMHTANVLEHDIDEPMGALPPQRLFSGASYQKGAAFIHAIRLEVGDEAFFAGLRLYFERFGGGTASRDDFQAVMEEASGMDLDALFIEWLE